MCPLAAQSLAVLAIRKSWVGRRTGNSALHSLLLPSSPIVVPAVLGLTMPHPALVSYLTSPRPIPRRGRSPTSLCDLVPNQEECDRCSVPGHASHLNLALCLLSSVWDFISFLWRILPPDFAFYFGDKLSSISVCNLHCIFMSFARWHLC